MQCVLNYGASINLDGQSYSDSETKSTHCFYGDKVDTTNSESDLHDETHFINKKKHILK